jgi:PTS system cellobiose-specific IIB component
MRILLSCSGGFSTSLVVSKMLEASKKHGVENKVWAVSIGDIRENINGADVVLIAPQISYAKKEIKAICDEHKKPFGIISHEDYGTCNGEHILEQAESLVKQFRGEMR